MASRNYYCVHQTKPTWAIFGSTVERIGRQKADYAG